MKKQIIVSGGLGFIGFHLIKRLIIENYFPIIVDDLSIGSLKILELLPKSKFHFIKCNITHREKLEEKLIKFKPETIIHLAAIHFIPYCNKNPEKTILINTVGTQLLLEIALKKNIKNFLFTSSGAVYKPSIYPHKENDLLKPIDIYGLSKKLGGEIIKFYGKTTALKFIILRLFNVYGPNDSTPHIIPALLSRLKKSNKIAVGDISTFRDYIYIDDVIEGIIKVLKSSKGFDNSIYNIGAGKNYSGKSLIKIISKITNREILVYKNQNLVRKVDRKALIADIAKFSKVYSWKPKYDVFQGIKELIKLELK